jgi:hypothetical protein
MRLATLTLGACDFFVVRLDGDGNTLQTSNVLLVE